MKQIFQEYGEFIVAGIIGIFCVVLIFVSLDINQNQLLEDSISGDTQNEMILRAPVPSINAENKRTTLNTEIDLKDEVYVDDGNGRDITSKLQAYSDVDYTKKGVYTIRYEVENDFGRKTKKKVFLIVD